MAKYKVLSTKKLEPSLIDKASENGIEVIEQEFISVKPVDNSDSNWPQALIDLANEGIVHAVFTSQNAALMLDRSLHVRDTYYVLNYEVFCLSGKTQEAVSQAVCVRENILGVADNSTSLAELIIEKGIKEVIFFCGNKRRDELPSQLKQAGITVHEIIVYETLETPKISSKDFDAILFFSPSAVQSFFSVNQLIKETVCFAIGQTTASSIADFTDNKIIVSESPSQEMMLAAVNFYFQNINCYE